MPLLASALICGLTLKAQSAPPSVEAILSQPPTVAGFEKIISTLNSGSNEDRHRILLVARKLRYDYSAYWRDLQFLSHAYRLDERIIAVNEKVRQWRISWGNALAKAALRGDSKVREEALDVLFGELPEIDLTTSPLRGMCGTGYSDSIEYVCTLGLEDVARTKPSLLQTRLSSTDYQTAYKAFGVLPESSPMRHEYLDRWLRSRKPEFRAMALYLLPNDESQYSKDVRIAMLADPDHWVSFAALDTFPQIDDCRETKQITFSELPVHARFYLIDAIPWQESDPILAIASGDRDPMVRLAAHYKRYWELESLSDSELIAGTQAYSADMIKLCIEELERREYPQLEAVCRRILLKDTEGCRLRALSYLAKKQATDLVTVFKNWMQQVRRPAIGYDIRDALWKAFTSGQLKELALSQDIRVRRIAFDLLTAGGFLGQDSEAEILEWTYPRMKQDKDLAIRTDAESYAPKTKQDTDRESIRKLIREEANQPGPQSQTIISRFLTYSDVQIREFAAFAIKVLDDILKNPPKKMGDGNISATK